MDLIQKMRRVEARMQQAFLRDRFDTFNHLACERLDLLREASADAAYQPLLEEAQRETERWVRLLEHRVDQGRRQLALKERYRTKRRNGVVLKNCAG